MTKILKININIQKDNKINLKVKKNITSFIKKKKKKKKKKNPQQ